MLRFFEQMQTFRVLSGRYSKYSERISSSVLLSSKLTKWCNAKQQTAKVVGRIGKKDTCDQVDVRLCDGGSRMRECKSRSLPL